MILFLCLLLQAQYGDPGKFYGWAALTFGIFWVSQIADILTTQWAVDYYPNAGYESNFTVRYWHWPLWALHLLKIGIVFAYCFALHYAHMDDNTYWYMPLIVAPIGYYCAIHNLILIRRAKKAAGK